MKVILGNSSGLALSQLQVLQTEVLFQKKTSLPVQKNTASSDLHYISLGEKRPYSELFWSVFSCIRTEYREILRISPCSVRMPENTDQSNSEHGHFLHSVCSRFYYSWSPQDCLALLLFNPIANPNLRFTDKNTA